MSPFLNDGDVVVINAAAAPRVGAIVVARHPFKKSVCVVKRIAKITPENRYVLTGDNAEESTDSRSFGTVSRADIFGVAVSRMPAGSATARFVNVRPGGA